MPETVTYRAVGKMVTDDKNAWICKACGDEAASEIARALNRLSCNVKEVREQPPEEMPETRYKSQGREVLRYQPTTGWEPYCTAPTSQEADRIALALGLYLLPLADVAQPECDHTPEFNAAQEDWLCMKCGKGMGKAYRQVAGELEQAQKKRYEERTEIKNAHYEIAKLEKRLESLTSDLECERLYGRKLEDRIGTLRFLCDQYQAAGVRPIADDVSPTVTVTSVDDKGTVTGISLDSRADDAPPVPPVPPTMSCGHPRAAAVEGSDPPYCAICRAIERAEAWKRRFHSIVALHIESAKLFQETLDATTQTH